MATEFPGLHAEGMSQGAESPQLDSVVIFLDFISTTFNNISRTYEQVLSYNFNGGTPAVSICFNVLIWFACVCAVHCSNMFQLGPGMAQTQDMPRPGQQLRCLWVLGRAHYRHVTYVAWHATVIHAQPDAHLLDLVGFHCGSQSLKIHRAAQTFWRREDSDLPKAL